MKNTTYFDDSLPRLIDIVKARWGSVALSQNVVLRDASGKLTFVVRDERTRDERDVLAADIARELGPYADPGGFSVSTPEELFDPSLSENIGHTVLVGSDHVVLVDRRMVGGDWLQTPDPVAVIPPRFVFASLKGGVGRSTALCVAAAHLAEAGQRVLIIDLDLEAPGIGSMLLDDDTRPDFGVLDYLVESEVGHELDQTFFGDLVAPSWLARGKGRIDVIPAIGQRSNAHPANVLAKLARAYLATSSNAGAPVTFADRIRMLLDRFAKPSDYDAVLIDARAGLHETTAAPLLSLGAEVLLFGLDQEQTYEAYNLLFSHLALLASQESEWQNRLHPVQAKAPADPAHRTAFSDRMTQIMQQLPAFRPLELVRTSPEELADSFDVVWSANDESAVEALVEGPRPPEVLIIRDDGRFRSFDPLADPVSLDRSVYEVSFGDFLTALNGMMPSSE